MRIHYLQHEPFEDPGSILEWITGRRYTATSTMVYEKEPLPSHNAFDMLVIMGGGMSVYEEDVYPWLVTEKRFIGETIRCGKPLLGICLGAQLIASTLGAAVYKNKYKEIGWFPVTLTDEARDSQFSVAWPDSFDALHWHGDTFDLPAGARWTAFSAATKNQSFEYGRTVGLQYHIESTPESVARLVSGCSNELVPGNLYIQSEAEILSYKKSFIPMKKQLFNMLDSMIDTVLS